MPPKKQFKAGGRSQKSRSSPRKSLNKTRNVLPPRPCGLEALPIELIYMTLEHMDVASMASLREASPVAMHVFSGLLSHMKEKLLFTHESLELNNILGAIAQCAVEKDKVKAHNATHNEDKQLNPLQTMTDLRASMSGKMRGVPASDGRLKTISHAQMPQVFMHMLGVVSAVQHFVKAVTDHFHATTCTRASFDHEDQQYRLYRALLLIHLFCELFDCGDLALHSVHLWPATAKKRTSLFFQDRVSSSRQVRLLTGFPSWLRAEIWCVWIMLQDLVNAKASRRIHYNAATDYFPGVVDQHSYWVAPIEPRIDYIICTSGLVKLRTLLSKPNHKINISTGPKAQYGMGNMMERACIWKDGLNFRVRGTPASIRGVDRPADGWRFLEHWNCEQKVADEDLVCAKETWWTMYDRRTCPFWDWTLIDHFLCRDERDTHYIGEAGRRKNGLSTKKMFSHLPPASS